MNILFELLGILIIRQSAAKPHNIEEGSTTMFLIMRTVDSSIYMDEDIVYTTMWIVDVLYKHYRKLIIFYEY